MSKLVGPFWFGGVDKTELAERMDHQRELGVTYSEIGATTGEMPTGFRHDERSQQLGRGDEVFARAVDALQHWKAHLGAGVGIFPADTALVEGATIATIIRLAPGVTLTAACRVVYVEDNDDEFAFGYGTLPFHPEQGEERFFVKRDEAGVVQFGLRSFSRPSHPVARLGSPAGRAYQIKVNRGYVRAMQEAVR